MQHQENKLFEKSIKIITLVWAVQYLKQL